MTSCGSCGAANPATAAWCSQCYAALSSAGAVPAPRSTPAPQPVAAQPLAAQPVAPSRFAPYQAASAQYTPPQYPAAPHPAAPHAAAHYTAQQYTPPQYRPPHDQLPTSATATATGGRLQSGRATGLVVAAICLGGVVQLVFLALSRRHLPVETLVRYDLFGVLVFYGVVLMMISTQLRTSIRLRWTTSSSKATAVVLGVAVGGGLAGAMTLVIANLTGSVTTDPSIALLASEGDAAHIVGVVLVTVIAAPVVEELLFRGLFAESLRERGPKVAIALSSVAFAVWHFRPAELRYYAIMGALLGTLYWKRGLVCSMSAHATFNGVLTAIAIWLAVAPGHLTTVNGLEVDAPRGWHHPATTQTAAASAPRNDSVLRGPSGAEVLVLTLPMRAVTTAEQIVDRTRAIAASVPPDVHVDVASARVVHLPVGEAASVDVTAGGDRGRLVMLPHDRTLYLVVFEGEGSVKAERDFERMLSSASVVGS